MVLSTHWRLRHRWKDKCSFQVFPHKCQTSLQLFELGDDYIQQDIRKPPQHATGSCVTGWFSSSVLDSLRFCVSVKFLSVYPEAGAKSLLKTASEGFKKSNRIQIYAKDSRPEEEVQQVNAEPIGKKDKEELDDDGDDEDEEDEIDDDNVEEELDPNEEFHVAGEDVNFVPQPSSCGHRLQDADDGEYQIYEQYSDGNCSDDDDY